MPLGRRLAAEALGTFALVFFGAGAITVDAKGGDLGQLGVALAFGLVITTMIYALGHISGAHLNPAVSFGFALSRHFPWRLVGAYWLAQCLGALAAALLLRPSLGAWPTWARRPLRARTLRASSGRSPSPSS